MIDTVPPVALDTAMARLRARFAEAGYQPVRVPHLMPGEALLDLYGEEIRARAFLFAGATPEEELCLRPDFTLPVVRAHGARGWERPARYGYAGPVFRRQPPGSSRPAEFLQAGIEDLGDADRATADARVFALVHEAVAEFAPGPLTIVTGDLGIIFALIAALPMSARQRHLLRRHFWRPRRFHALIEEAVAGPPRPTPLRARLLAAAAIEDAAAAEEAVAALARAAGEPIGLREIDEVVARARRLAAAAAEPPMPRSTAETIEAALAVRAPAAEALNALAELARAAQVDIGPALAAFEARLEALATAGIDAGALPFDAAFGRRLEYYDGFVFEISAAARAELPALAGGGRYDSLTLRLGAPRAVPAVGAMLRPEAALAAAPTARHEGAEHRP